MPNYIQRKLAEKTAKSIGKEEYLGLLKEEWKKHISRNSDVDEEVRKAWNRVKKSGYLSVFKVVGVTEDDIRNLVTEIIEEKKSS